MWKTWLSLVWFSSVHFSTVPCLEIAAIGSLVMSGLKGRLVVCNPPVFGGENDYCPNKAGLRNCDFTAATLNFCTFFNCTPDDLRLPGWPHVTIFSPRQNADDFTDLTSDPILAGIHGIMRVTSPKEVAITYDMTDYVKKWRADVLQGREFQKLLARIRSEPEPPEPVISLERIRELLKKKPYVFM